MERDIAEYTGGIYAYKLCAFIRFIVIPIITNCKIGIFFGGKNENGLCKRN